MKPLFLAISYSSGPFHKENIEQVPRPKKAIGGSFGGQITADFHDLYLCYMWEHQFCTWITGKDSSEFTEKQSKSAEIT